MDLTQTVKGQLETCRRMATAALISGHTAYVTVDIMRTHRLLAHHKGEQAYENLRNIINELFMELNYIAELSNDARKKLEQENIDMAKALERVKAFSHRSHSSDEWIHAITEALAERLGGTRDDIRVARDVAERRLRESDADED